MKPDQNFKVAISTIAGSSFSNFKEAFKDRRVDPEYRGRKRTAALISFLTEPFRWYEHWRFDQKIDHLEMEEPPIFLLGHWRSGTTLLHNLMCQDPLTSYVTTYQGVFPDFLLGSRWLFLNLMKWTMPEKRPSDNVKLAADAPQEEEFALGNIHPYCYYYFWYFPNETRALFDRFIRFQGVDGQVREAWKKHYLHIVKKSIYHLKRPRFVSKNPPHTGRIPILKELFPNARFVYIYRNPITVFESTKKLITSTIPPLTFQKPNADVIEADIFYIYEQLIRQYEQDKQLLKPEELVEVKYETLEQQPLTEMRRIYEQLNLRGWEATEKPLKAYIESQQRYEKNSYRIQKSGLEKILTHWQFAMDLYQYDLPSDLKIMD